MWDQMKNKFSMSSIFSFNHKLIPPDPDFFSSGLSFESDDKYIMKDREDYFTGAQRAQIVWQILLRTPYDTTRPDKVGVVRLMNKQVFKARILN